MSLVYITVAGDMIASAWGCMLGDDTADMVIPFSRDFLLDNGQPQSPWATYWTDIRDALDVCTSSGDLIGGRGDVTDAYITFHYAGEGTTRTETFELKPGRYTRDFFAVGGSC